MKGFTRLVGKMPFCGKYRIRKWSFRYFQSVNRFERWKHYIILLTMLLFDVLSHAVLALLAATLVSDSVPYWANAIFALYFLANGCSAIAQAHLIYRASRFQFNLRSPYPRRARSLPAYNFSGRVVSIVVTAIGQALFFVAFLQYT